MKIFIYIMIFFCYDVSGQTYLFKLKSPVIFQGDSMTAYRDPAVLYHNKIFHMFFTLVETEVDGRIFSYTAKATSKDLKIWTSPKKITKRDQKLNFSSPGNIIRYKDEWILCLQSYPRPGLLSSQAVSYGDSTARLYIMRSKDLDKWTNPEIIKVKGSDVTFEKMGRMIDPYLIKDKDVEGKFWCFYKQNGVSMSYTYDFKNWTFFGFTESGENVCVLNENDDYILFNSPSNGVSMKKSKDLKDWSSSGDVITLGQNEWEWAKGRITAGFVINLKRVEGYESYIMFFHGSGPLTESRGDFDKNSSIGLAWSKDLITWAWPK